MEYNEILRNSILYLVPFYKADEGDITIIVCKEGRKFEIQCNIKTVIKNICQHYYVDIISLRKRSSEIVKQKNLLPIVINKQLIILPLKIRKPLSKNDSAYGYINNVFVKDVITKGNFSKILFQSGEELSTIQYKKSIDRKRIQAEYIAENLLSENLYGFTPNKNEEVKEDIKKIIYKLVNSL